MIKIEYGIVNDKDICYTIKTDKEVVRFPHSADGTEMFVTYLNNLFKKLEEKPIDLHVNFEEWNERVDWLDKTSRRLVQIDEIYMLESDKILAEARENNVDFKAIYGANNKDTRKQYVDEQLTDLLEEKKELEFLKSNDNRRISLLKRLIDMKIELIKFSGDYEKT